MGDILSQDEINALLGVVDGTSSNDDNIDEKEEATNEEQSKEEQVKEEPKQEDNDTTSNSDNDLTEHEKDVLGELGNISMGTSATTLFTILRNKVQITTPIVEVLTWSEIAASYDRPCVGIRVNYKEGFKGSNVLVLKERDVKIICNLMMGGDGNINEEEPLNEIDLSAIGEAMNQMVGSSATSLSSMLDMKVDIDTPQAFLIDFNDDDFFEKIGIEGSDKIVRTSFRMVVGDIIDSNIMQILPLNFAKEMVELLNKDMKQNEPEPEVKVDEPPKVVQESKGTMNENYNITEDTPNYKSSPRAESRITQARDVNVSPAQFQNFDISELNQQKENIDILMDVPLEVTVELGRTRKKIKEILEFSPGTIVELDKIAGEPIDILVNGKFIAKGEVVVIDENFGVRIVDIISAENRI